MDTKVTIVDTELVVPHSSASSEQIALAEKYTLWSWYDVMTAMNELGVDPSANEKERILKALFLKKLKHIINQGSYDGR